MGIYTGATFWSTVFRLPLIFAGLTVVFSIYVLVAQKVSLEQFDSLQPIDIALGFIVGPLTVPLAAGWGFAYRKFDERPIPKGKFYIGPFFSGLIFGLFAGGELFFSPVLSEATNVQPVSFIEKMQAFAFFVVSAPPMMLLMALFTRYAPIGTGAWLGKRR